MKRLIIPLLFLPVPVVAAMDDDPLLVGLEVDRFEAQESSAQVLEGSVWAGRDLSRWVMDVELERERGKTEMLAIDLYQRRPVHPYWNVEVGLRQEPLDGHSWFSLGVSGLAPWFVETEITLYLKERQSQIVAQFEYELPITANWMLQALVEIQVNGDSDGGEGRGSGLATVESGLQLRYERFKNIHPYLGFESVDYHGDTADYRQRKGEGLDQTVAVIGIAAWF